MRGGAASKCRPKGAEGTRVAGVGVVPGGERGWREKEKCRD